MMIVMVVDAPAEAQLVRPACSVAVHVGRSADGLDVRRWVVEREVGADLLLEVPLDPEHGHGAARKECEVEAEPTFVVGDVGHHGVAAAAGADGKPLHFFEQRALPGRNRHLFHEGVAVVEP